MWRWPGRALAHGLQGRSGCRVSAHVVDQGRHQCGPPLPPRGWPRAIAPPFWLTSPVGADSASQAKWGNRGERLVDLAKTPISASSAALRQRCSWRDRGGQHYAGSSAARTAVCTGDRGEAHLGCLLARRHEQRAAPSRSRAVAAWITRPAEAG